MYIFLGALASHICWSIHQYNIWATILHQVRCGHQNTTLALWKDLLKTPNEMYDFIYRDNFLFTRMWWGWEKPRKRKGNETKKFPFGCPPTHFYDMEADYFPVSENTENKSDLTATKLAEWMTDKCYRFIGRVHCISRIWNFGFFVNIRQPVNFHISFSAV